jgi:hypothetical protein
MMYACIASSTQSGLTLMSEPEQRQLASASAHAHSRAVADAPPKWQTSPRNFESEDDRIARCDADRDLAAADAKHHHAGVEAERNDDAPSDSGAVVLVPSLPLTTGHGQQVREPRHLDGHSATSEVLPCEPAKRR